MFDYLNEVLMLYGARNRRNGTYKKAMLIKQRGDANIFNALCREWCSRFKWEYQGDTIAPELIERTILFNGYCGLAEIAESNGSFADSSWRNFRVSAVDNQSFYGYPNSVELTDYVGRPYGRYIPVHDEDTSDIANCALIQDNFHGWTPLLTILYYAERMSQINASIEACIRNILGTSVIQCTHGQERQIVKQMTAASLGTPYIITYDENDIHPIEPKLLSTPGASDSLITLYESWDKTHGDYLQSIGIRTNAEINKKSGITPMEIVEDRQNVDLILNDGLNARLKGIKHFERIGGSGLSVTLDNFEGLVSDYDKNGNRIRNIDPLASNQPEEQEGDKNNVVDSELE